MRYDAIRSPLRRGAHVAVACAKMAAALAEMRILSVLRELRKVLDTRSRTLLMTVRKYKRLQETVAAQVKK